MRETCAISAYVRFPSPRYPTFEALPSLLSPISPLPFPAPQTLNHVSDPPLQPHPLTGTELHLRLILHSLTSQISEICNYPSFQTSSSEGDTRHLSVTSSPLSMAIPARDFMIFRIPEHELSDGAAEEVRLAGEEARRVTREWEEHGGLWVGAGEDRRWIGVEDPSDA